MSSYDEIQAEYAKVYPSYHRLAERLKSLLRQGLDNQGLRLVEVSARPKEPSSFLKKAMRKGYADPITAIGDKAGARIIVPFSRDRANVLAVCETILELSEPEDKRDKLGSETVGYLGLHYSAVIRTELLDAHETDLAGLRAELQIHTKAENAWASVAHDSLYKSVVPVPAPVARRLMRLAALAEIFDDEVERFRVELAAQPGFSDLEAILPPLDAMLLRFTPRAGDPGLSALLIPAIRSLYDCAADAIVDSRIAPYLEEHHEEIQALYSRHEGDERANPLLYQPEVLLLFERLDTNPYTVRPAWPPMIEIELLERLAVLRGRRLA